MSLAALRDGVPIAADWGFGWVSRSCFSSSDVDSCIFIAKHHVENNSFSSQLVSEQLLSGAPSIVRTHLGRRRPPRNLHRRPCSSPPSSRTWELFAFAGSRRAVVRTQAKGKRSTGVDCSYSPWPPPPLPSSDPSRGGLTPPLLLVCVRSRSRLPVVVASSFARGQGSTTTRLRLAPDRPDEPSPPRLPRQNHLQCRALCSPRILYVIALSLTPHSA